MFEGIILGVLNWYVTIIFAALSDIQSQLNPENAAFNLGLIFDSWAIAYFLFAYVVPVIAAYVWARKTGVAVYGVGWLGATMFLGGSFRVGLILLVAASLLVVIVDVFVNSGGGRRRRLIR